jgi:hypothetical protein
MHNNILRVMRRIWPIMRKIIVAYTRDVCKNSILFVNGVEWSLLPIAYCCCCMPSYLVGNLYVVVDSIILLSHHACIFYYNASCCCRLPPRPPRKIINDASQISITLWIVVYIEKPKFHHHHRRRRHSIMTLCWRCRASLLLWPGTDWYVELDVLCTVAG